MPARAALLLVTLVACESGAPHARRAIRETHVPSCLRAIREDIGRHHAGIATAADRVAPGFAVEDATTRERQLRAALRLIQEPESRRAAVPELVASPMSFLAVVDAAGIVIARDTRRPEDDRMKGENFGQRFPVIARALGGAHGYELGEFPSEEGQPSSWSMMFVHPVRREGAVVGAIIAGIPLWRMARRLSEQLKVENASTEGIILWAFLAKADQVFAPELGLDLEQAIPNGAARTARMAESAGGYTDEVQQFGRWFALGVVPLPAVAADVALVVFRSDPT